MYKYLYSLYFTKNESPQIVIEGFPFESEEQRLQFQKYRGEGLVRTFHLTPEEMERELAKYRKK